VLRARTGQEGIDLGKSQLPDLILLDLIMPGLSGFDVVEALARGSDALDSDHGPHGQKLSLKMTRRALNGRWRHLSPQLGCGNRAHHRLRGHRRQKARARLVGRVG